MGDLVEGSPSGLLKGAAELEQISNLISNVAKQLENAPKGSSEAYRLAAGSSKGALKLSSTIKDQSAELKRRANLFEQAGNAGIGEIRNLNTAVNNWINANPLLLFFGTLAIFPLNSINSISLLGKLFSRLHQNNFPNFSVPPNSTPSTVVVGPIEGETYLKINRSINMRESPGTSSLILTTLAPGASVKIVDSITQKEGVYTWIKVETQGVGKTGWIAQEANTAPIHTYVSKLPDGPQNIISVTETKIKAEQVSIDDGRVFRVGGLYSHYDETGKYKSNCTWYAAAAMKDASGGIIDLNSGKAGPDANNSLFSTSLGDAESWGENARTFTEYKPYVSDVNKHPEAPSIFQDGGHVMFVEKASHIEIAGKKYWEVVISEENYYLKKYGPYATSVEVVIPGNTEVKRWRRTLTWEAKEGQDQFANTTGNFIHFTF